MAGDKRRWEKYKPAWKYITDSPTHAEARGIQALLSRGIDPTNARQATTLPSCIDCSQLQDKYKIINLTGKVKGINDIKL